MPPASVDDIDLDEVSTPLTAPERHVVLEEVGHRPMCIGKPPSLEKALAKKSAPRCWWRRRFRGIVTEFFDVKTRLRDLLLLIERSARSVPTLHDAFYVQFRGEGLRALERFSRVVRRAATFARSPIRRSRRA